jgi:branched-chain amino acid transport system ATP-binding protein
VLSLKRVDTRYGGLHVLKGVSLEVSAGEIVTLVGANGAGKTTLLWAISGFVIPFEGEIEFLGQRIRGLSPELIVKMGISQVPEGRAIFPLMTVVDNLEMGAYVRRDKKEIVADLGEVYELFPILKERKGQLAGTLSGGEQQMLAIARGVMSRPRLFLLDEPSLGLAPLLVEAIGGIIREINSRGVTILLVEQNVNMALQMASRGYVLEIGKIVLEGTGEELLNNDLVKKAYLGL